MINPLTNPPIIEVDKVYNLDCLIGLQQMRTQGIVAD